MGGPTSKIIASDDSLSGKLNLLSSSLMLHILSLALPLTMMQVYDRIILNRSISTLTWLVVGCLMAITMELGLRHLRTRLGNILAARFEQQTSVNALRHILGARLEQFENTSASTHLERFQAIATLRNFYSGQLYQVLLDLPFAIVFLVVIGYLGGWVVLVPIFFGLLTIALVFYCRHMFDIHNEEQSTSTERRQSFLMQLLESLPTVKSLTMEEQMLRRFERLQAQKVDQQRHTNAWADLPTQLGPTFSQLTMFSTILVCAQLVLNGDMTLGGLTACMMLSSRALQPIQQSASFWIKLPAVRQAKEQVALIEELEKDLNTDIPEEQPADLMGEVSVENLSFRYAETEPWIAEDLSFSIPARTSLAITGPSKNGSTTLMMMLLGLLNPEKGRVCIDNIPLDKLSSSTLDGKVQYLPRNGMLFKGSILDNITTFKPQLQPLALSSATLLGLDPIIAALPQGYETMVDSRSRLSTEIIHRITLARSLVHRPRILIADKTTASMDRRSEEAFLELLELLKPMCTIIIITQWPQLLEWCDQAYEFKHGKFGPYSPKKKSWFS